MKASAVADRRLRALAVVAAAWIATTAPAAQLRVQPVGEHPGDMALRLMLRKLTTVGTFMQTNAHPDDEDNVLLARLGHGLGMRTVLVSATRGEGGQNEIGPELSESLSVLRTEELLAAHRFDGAEQLFTRAVDFGFSFSVEESIERWGRAEIVGDLVRHIRATRPHVVAAFVCGGEGGGQHHQASTVLTIEAVRDAADPAKYPEHMRQGLRPWRVLRLFCTQGFGRPAEGPDVLTVDGREFDPLIGRTYGELGTEARSMHKCQGTSQLLPLPGGGFGRIYRLLDDAPAPSPRPLETMFGGIDTSIEGLARFAGGDDAIASALRGISEAAAAGKLATGLRSVRELRRRLAATRTTNPGHDEIEFRMEQKERQFERALLLSRRTELEAVADDGVVVAGQAVKVNVIVASHDPDGLEVRGISLAGLRTTAAPCRGTATAGSPVTCTAEARVAAAEATSIYWTARRDAARYDFAPLPAGVPFGVPFAPSPFRARFDLAIDGLPVTVEQPVEYRYGDIVAGEKRMELHVVPPFGVALSPSTVIVPTGGKGRTAGPRAVRVTVTNSTQGPASGEVRLRAPEGFTVAPRAAAVKFSREDEVVTVTFDVRALPGVRPGAHALAAAFGSAGGDAESGAGFDVIEYPHVTRRHLVRPASGLLKAIDVRVADPLRVGYVMGVGDQVPQAIEQLGVVVHLIGPEELVAGDLAQYDVIVTGVRAYERRADLRASNHRLIAYAERGGTVLVQYNKFEFNEAQYGPYPAKISANRITDENAPVDVLVPEHPVFNRPNRIDAETWKGWVQERGLYFLGDRDPRYVDLVRLTDPFPFNKGPKTGALVEAKVGKGRWIYIGLGLWRQLPAGTDGAYRLLANLISLGSAR
jgi:LmbE family N-acetylglucosaminyl deacetylase